MEVKKAAEYDKHNAIKVGMAIVIVLAVTLYLALTPRFMFDEKYVRKFGVLLLLLFFEFINLCMHAIFEKWMEHNPLLVLLALVILGVVVNQLHHFFEERVLKPRLIINRYHRMAFYKLRKAKASEKLKLLERGMKSRRRGGKDNISPES